MELPCAASCTASCPKNGLPHAPNVSTTSGMHFHSSSEQIGSLYVCFLSTVCLAAAPVTTPASYKMLDLSGEVMDTSMAKAVYLSTSLESEFLQVLLASFRDPNQHQLPGA